jgi:hypothetical protein
MSHGHVRDRCGVVAERVMFAPGMPFVVAEPKTARSR